MLIKVQNQANISNKYVRFAKWQAYKVKSKFDEMEYVEIFIKKNSSANPVYRLTLKIGVKGYDIVISAKNENLYSLFNDAYKTVIRQLRKRKSSFRKNPS